MTAEKLSTSTDATKYLGEQSKNVTVEDVEWEETEEFTRGWEEEGGCSHHEVEEEVFKVEIETKVSPSQSRDNTHSREEEGSTEMDDLDISQLASECSGLEVNCVLRNSWVENSVLAVAATADVTTTSRYNAVIFEAPYVDNDVQEEDFKSENFEEETYSTGIRIDRNADEFLFGDDKVIMDNARPGGVVVELYEVSDDSTDFYAAGSECSVDEGVWSDAVTEEYLNLAPALTEEASRTNDVCTSHYEPVHEVFSVEPSLIVSEFLENNLVGRFRVENKLEESGEMKVADGFEEFAGEKHLSVEGVGVEGPALEGITPSDLSSVPSNLENVLFKVFVDDIDSVEDLQGRIKMVTPKTMSDLETYAIETTLNEGRNEVVGEVVHEHSSAEVDFKEETFQAGEVETPRVEEATVESALYSSSVEQLTQGVVVAECEEFDAEEIKRSLSELVDESEIPETDLNILEALKIDIFKVENVLEKVEVESSAEFLLRFHSARMTHLDTIAVADDLLKEETLEILEKLPEAEPKVEVKEVKSIEASVLEDATVPAVMKQEGGQTIKRPPNKNVSKAGKAGEDGKETGVESGEEKGVVSRKTEDGIKLAEVLKPSEVSINGKVKVSMEKQEENGDAVMEKRVELIEDLKLKKIQSENPEFSKISELRGEKPQVEKKEQEPQTLQRHKKQEKQQQQQLQKECQLQQQSKQLQQKLQQLQQSELLQEQSQQLQQPQQHKQQLHQQQQQHQQVLNVGKVFQGISMDFLGVLTNNACYFPFPPPNTRPLIVC